MSRHRPLPTDIIERFGHLPDHEYRGGGEHSSACPTCGGARGGPDPSDRFRFWEREGQACNFWCRRCGLQGFTDDNKPSFKITPQQMAELERTRQREAEREAERLRLKIEALQNEAYWKGYHDAMNEQQRQTWHQRGVCDYLIDYYSLGYRTDYTLTWDGNQWTTPALSIPHYADEWQLTNVQYRLQEPPPGAGKYRQTAGLPAAMFRTEPEQALSGAVLVVEGAIKSIVLYQHLGMQPLGFPLTIVGIPSKVPSAEMLKQLADAEPVYIGLDPDAYPDGSAQRVGAKLGIERVRYVHFPKKPDDLIVEYGLSGDDIKKYLKQATVTA